MAEKNGTATATVTATVTATAAKKAKAKGKAKAKKAPSEKALAAAAAEAAETGCENGIVFSFALFVAPGKAQHFEYYARCCVTFLKALTAKWPSAQFVAHLDCAVSVDVRKQIAAATNARTTFIRYALEGAKKKGAFWVYSAVRCRTLWEHSGPQPVVVCDVHDEPALMIRTTKRLLKKLVAERKEIAHTYWPAAVPECLNESKLPGRGGRSHVHSDCGLLIWRDGECRKKARAVGKFLPHIQQTLKDVRFVPRGVDEMLLDGFLTEAKVFAADSDLAILVPHKHQLANLQTKKQHREAVMKQFEAEGKLHGDGKQCDSDDDDGDRDSDGGKSKANGKSTKRKQTPAAAAADDDGYVSEEVDAAELAARRKMRIGGSTVRLSVGPAGSTELYVCPERNPELGQKQKEFQAKWRAEHNDECEVCEQPGKLVCCDHCNLVWHSECFRPQPFVLPRGTWRCPHCIVELADKSDDETDATAANGKAKHPKGKGKGRGKAAQLQPEPASGVSATATATANGDSKALAPKPKPTANGKAKPKANATLTEYSAARKSLELMAQLKQQLMRDNPSAFVKPNATADAHTASTASASLFSSASAVGAEDEPSATAGAAAVGQKRKRVKETPSAVVAVPGADESDDDVPLRLQTSKPNLKPTTPASSNGVSAVSVAATQRTAPQSKHRAKKSKPTPPLNGKGTTDTPHSTGAANGSARADANGVHASAAAAGVEPSGTNAKPKAIAQSKSKRSKQPAEDSAVAAPAPPTDAASATSGATVPATAEADAKSKRPPKPSSKPKVKPSIVYELYTAKQPIDCPDPEPPRSRKGKGKGKGKGKASATVDADLASA